MTITQWSIKPNSWSGLVVKLVTLELDCCHSKFPTSSGYLFQRIICRGCLVVQSCLTLWTHELQQVRLPYPSPSSGVCSNSCPLSQWCHQAIPSSVAPFSSCPQSFPASGSFPMSWLFISGGQSIGASASASVLPMNIQGWFPLGLTGLISLLPKGFSRVFSSSTVQKHQFFGLLYGPTFTPVRDYWEKP